MRQLAVSGPGGSSLVTPRRLAQINPHRELPRCLPESARELRTITTDLNAANYILVFVGVTGEAEGSDRSNLALQASEGETAVSAALAATNGANKTIVGFRGRQRGFRGYVSTAPAIPLSIYRGMQPGQQHWPTCCSAECQSERSSWRSRFRRALPNCRLHAQRQSPAISEMPIRRTGLFQNG